MDCSNCRRKLFTADQLFFYHQAEKQIHLSLKPELRAMIEGQSLEVVGDKPKNTVANCKFCAVKLGKILPFGPNGTSFIAFGTEKVSLCGRQLRQKEQWRDCMFYFPSIDQRNTETFFGAPKPELKEEKVEVPASSPIVFPSEINHFDWSLPLSPKQPRPYQATAFVEALQRDLIVVIPTGAGKTLIASMLMLRMRELNPRLLSVFVVDRVPLVFQQADCIALDTGLRICRLCGENRSPAVIRGLKDGSFDGLVVTAGALVEILNRKHLFVEQFSCVIFDECHHASGNHPYVDVLNLIKEVPLNSRPRILGLSASPFPAATTSTARISLAKFCMQFSPAVVYRPEAPRLTQQPVEWAVIDNSSTIELYVHSAREIFNQLLSSIPTMGHRCVLLDRFNSNIIKGQLRAVRDGMLYWGKQEHSLIEGLILLLESIEISQQIGIQEALSVFTNQCLLAVPRISQLVSEYRHCNEASPKLKQLDRYLQQCNKKSRVLVFVNTRETCRHVFNYVQQRFPHLHPTRVIGHGGHDGMHWEEEQEPNLANFGKGRCNLIICTSVLEEGLDVPQCDLVIRFSSVVSLIKFVQTRGRARQDHSRFVIFVDSRERHRITELEHQEQIMDNVLKQHAVEVGLPSVRTKQIIDDLLKLKPELANQEKKLKLAVVESCALKVLVADLENITEDFQADFIKELEQSQFLKVQKIFILSNTERDGAAFAPGTTAGFTMSARSFTRGLSAEIAYQQLCTHWGFGLKGHPTAKVWSQIVTKPSRCREKYQIAWTVSSLSFGNFLNRQRFEQSSVIEELDAKIMLYFIDDTTLELRIDGDDYRRKVVIRFTGLQNFALIDWSNPSFPQLYLPIKTVPALLSEDEKREYLNLKFRSNPHYYDHLILNNFAQHGVVALSIDLTTSGDCRQQAFLLRKVLTTSYYFPAHLYDTRVTVVGLNDDNDTRQRVCELACVNTDVWNVLWDVTVLKSQKSVALSDSLLTHLNKQLLSKSSLPEVSVGLRFIQSLPVCSYWIDLKMQFEEAENLEIYSVHPSRRRTKNRFEIQRVVVTPTRNIFYPSITMKTCRLLRLFSDHNFLIVGFRDEQLQKLQGVVSFDFVKDILRDGLVLNGRRYHFVCASASQQRDHKAFFVAAESRNVADRIRSQIILNQNDFKSVAQYSSRLGLFCTSDIPTLIVPLESMASVNDIEAKNRDKLTDGAGLIRLSTASEIAKMIGMEKTPAAFQVRIAGIKGVLLTMNDELVAERFGPKCLIVYHNSMFKFKSNDYTLGIVSVSKFIPLFLNRNVITLLEAINLDIVPVLHEMLDTTLSQTVQMLVKPAVATETLQKFVPEEWNVDEVRQSGFNLLEEPFWLRVLKGAFDFTIDDLRRRTRIPVEEGALLMGAADPFGILKDGEIFVQIQKNDDSEVHVVTGEVIVYRNPCLHPGDIRLVTAVNKPVLSNYKNVVLMPARPDCHYSLSATCSGGDLDGDLFAIIWDHRLIPSPSCIRKPLDYASLARNMPIDLDVLSPSALAGFYVKCMLNDTLGRVAHIHLALCDLLEDGATNPLAMKLAESQSVAVDFPKTGILPEVPTKALDLVKEKGYPDFMEKGEMRSYYSRKVLGELYRNTCSFSSEMTFSKKTDLDPDLFVKGYEQYLKSAREDYASYRNSMQRIMFQFGLKEEFEVILGRATAWDVLLRADAGKAALMIQDAYAALKKEFRTRFKQNLTNDNNQRNAKAYAWYYTVYRSGQSSESFLSFAWIISDILCSIKRSRFNFALLPSLEFSAYKTIGKGARSYFLENSSCLNQLISQRASSVSRIASAVKKASTSTYSLDVLPYGSVSVFLCDSASDVDLALIPQLLGSENPLKNCTPEMQACHILQTLVSPALDDEVETKQEVFSSRVPHMKCRMRDGDSMIDIDISMNSIGLRKTEIIQSIYASKPEMLVCLWFLVRWARAVGIIKDNRMPREMSLIPSADFYCLVLNFIFPEMSTVQPRSGGNKSLITIFDSVVDKLESSSDESDILIGGLIVKFLEKASMMRGNQTVTWNDPVIPNSVLKEDAVKEISVMCMNAWHTLLASRNIELLISFHGRTNQKNFSCRLPPSLSRTMAESLEFHSSRLSLLTNAEVSLRLLEDNSAVMLTSVGTRSEIFLLNEELESMINTNRFASNGVLRSKSSRYFMTGSDLLLVAWSNSSNAQVEFIPNRGPFQAKHHILERSGIKLVSERYLGDWKLVALEKFVAHIFKQLAQFPSQNAELLKTLDVNSRFGNFYLMHVSSCLPETRRTLSISELQEVLEKSRNSRKNYLRDGYDDETPPEEKPLPSGDVTVLKPSQSNPLSETVRILPAKRNKKGLATNFCIGVNNENKSNDEILRSVKDSYRRALKQTDFHLAEKEASFEFLASVTISKSYEAKVLMDTDMKVIDCKERDLHWANALILHGEDLSASTGIMEKVDLRICLVTAEPVRPNSKIHRLLFPDGVETPPITVGDGVKIGVASHLKRSTKDKVHFVHHKQRSERFRYSGSELDSWCEATVSCGTTYQGKHLQLKFPFYKLTLHFDAEPFRNAIKNSCHTALRKLTQDVFFMSPPSKGGFGNICFIKAALT